MSDRAHLAIDLGAESGRAMLGTVCDDRVELIEIHRFVNRPVDTTDGLLWDMASLWNGVLTGVRSGCTRADQLGIQLESVGVDSWGVDYVLLDSNHELTAPPRAYRDGRCHGAFERLVETHGRESLFMLTGTQLMPINTLFQIVAQYEDDPQAVERASHLLMLPDYMHFLLSGELHCEVTDASTSHLLDARSRSWNTTILEEAGVPDDVFLPVADPGPIGRIHRDRAREIGNATGIEVVVPASHDTASAVAAVPADDGADWCFLSSGTWSLLGAELDEPLITPDVARAGFTNELGVCGTVRFLKNITGLWLVQECRRDFVQRGQDIDYDRLTSLAAEAAPFRTLIDPDCGEFTHPGGMTERIASFARATGQPEPNSMASYVRCCLESLALAYRLVLTELETILGRTFPVVHLIGGGGRNTLLNQMTADATGRTVIVGPYEATSLGNILVQMSSRAESLSLDTIRSFARRSVSTTTYVPTNADAWGPASDRMHRIVRKVEECERD